MKTRQPLLERVDRLHKSLELIPVIEVRDVALVGGALGPKSNLRNAVVISHLKLTDACVPAVPTGHGFVVMEQNTHA